MRSRALPFAVAFAFAVALLLPTGSAAAGSGAGPTAIAASPDGAVFAGFKSGAIVEFAGGTGAKGGRLDVATGRRRGSVGGIVALDFAPGARGRLWVLDENGRVQQFSASGKLRRSLRLPDCSGGTVPAAGVRGGLDVTRDSVYVAHPCRDSVARYDRSKLKLRAAAKVPGAHGVAAQADLKAPRPSRRLFVAEPGTAQVAILSLRGLRPRDPLGVRGPAADVYAGPDGRLFVSVTHDDVRSGERIYVYDAAGNEIGNLGRPGTELGDLNDPVAFDFHPLDTGVFSEDLFIAESGNERIQRWSDDGFTFWGTPAADPDGAL